jgi:hypothetical protein
MKVRLGDGPISLEEAKMIFHEYYDRTTKSDLGRLRAKMFDIMYHRPNDHVLEPGSPESIKYALPRGPKNFDMKGVDWFPVGTEVCIEDPVYNKDNGREICIKVKGAKRLKTGETFKEHFARKYKERRQKGDLKEKNLVDIKNYKQAHGIMTKRRPKLLVPPKKTDGFHDDVGRFRHLKCSRRSKVIECLADGMPDFSRPARRIMLDDEEYYIDDRMAIYNKEFTKLGRLPDVNRKLVKALEEEGYLNEDGAMTAKLSKLSLEPLDELFGRYGLERINNLGQS